MPTTLNDVRFSYANLFQAKPPFNNPNGEPKFSVTILVPKTNAAAKAAMDTAIQAAIEAGVGKCWNGQRPPQPAICVHDGDGVRPSDGMPYGEECRGCWVFTASSKQAPFVVDVSVQPIMDQRQVYSGMYGNVSVNFFPYANSGKKGIGCGLNGVQKTGDGEALAGHVSAEEAFQAVAAGGAMPATPGYAVPGYAPAAPVAPAYPQQTAPTPAYPGYPQQVAAPVASYPAAPVGAYPGYPAVDPITGQPYNPTGAPIMGV